jgi:hypothetical protein
MARTEEIWAAVMAVEDEHGEEAKAFARDLVSRSSATSAATYKETLSNGRRLDHASNRAFAP